MSGRLTRMLRLFVPGSIRAREDARWCYIDPLPSGSYNHQLLRSRAEGDFVRHPDYLWSPTPYWTARGGLNGHLRELADRLDGLVYSDVLIVLHPEDHARTEASMLASWQRAARDELAECFERLVSSQGFTKAFADRPLQLKVVRDGDPALGVTVGLQPGEFATGLLPNLYLGQAECSAPLVEVFAADERGRFGSIGTLYSDQMAFTVGAHALDNGRVERLGDSALYTLHRFPGQPGLHHKVNGERADRVVIETGSAHGGETIRLVDRGRDKVLLEVMLVAARELDSELPDRDEPRGPRPTVGLPGFLPAGQLAGTILPEGLDLGTLGAFSIIPDALPQRIHTLSERAFLLQRLHFRGEMLGYCVELDRRGGVAPTVAEPVARFEVAEDRVSVVGVARDLALDGAPIRPGQCVPLRGPSHRLSWRDGELDYRPLRRPADRKWPYIARLDAPRRSTPLPEGEVWTIGRDGEACDVALPDRSVRSNIRWRDGRDEGLVDVQGGRVDRARFRTDAICVATRAASLDLRAEVPLLENLSERCPIHVVRGAEVLRLKQGSSVPLEADDELLIGNQAFRLVAPGGAEKPAEVKQLRPQKERLQEGPGTRGRRPRVGGSSGALVESSKTYRAALGINPQAAGQPSVRPPRGPAVLPSPPEPPEPPAAAVSSRSLRITPIAAVSPPPRQLAQTALVEVGDGPVDAQLHDLPTHALPSLSLDPTVDEWFTAGDIPSLLDGAPTIVDDDPDWRGLLRAASSLVGSEGGPPPRLSSAGPTQAPPAFSEPATSSPGMDGPRPVPRGLRLDAAIAPGVRLRRLRGSGGLPAFGPLPPRRRPPGTATPSASGD